MNRFIFPLFAIALVFAFSTANAASKTTYTVDFEQFADALKADAIQNGSLYGWSWNNSPAERLYSGNMPDSLLTQISKSDSFEAGGLLFSSSWSSTNWEGIDYSFWSGFGISSVTDNTSVGFANEMAAITGSGDGPDSDVYAVLYEDGTITLPENASIVSIMIANTLYAYDTMLNGNYFTDPFKSGEGDYLNLIISGIDSDGNKLDNTVTTTLANSNDEFWPLNGWLEVDLTSLADAVELVFSFDSSATDEYGITIPTYLAIDNIVYTVTEEDGEKSPPATTTTPEPGTIALFGLGLAAFIAARRKSR